MTRIFQIWLPWEDCRTLPYHMRQRRSSSFLPTIHVLAGDTTNPNLAAALSLLVYRSRYAQRPP